MIIQERIHVDGVYMRSVQHEAKVFTYAGPGTRHMYAMINGEKVVVRRWYKHIYFNSYQRTGS